MRLYTTFVVTDPNARTPRSGYENRVPRSTEDFVRYFQNSELGRRNKDSIRAYLEEFDMGEYVLPSSIVTSGGSTSTSGAASSSSSARNSVLTEKERQNASTNVTSNWNCKRNSDNPRLSSGALTFAETVSRLLFPFMVTFLLVFLVIFEYVLGAFAELTRFAGKYTEGQNAPVHVSDICLPSALRF